MTDQTHAAAAATSPTRPWWLVVLAYVSAFVLGSMIDIIRHSYDRIIAAQQTGVFDDATIRRAVIGGVLVLIIALAAVFGPRWCAKRLGPMHRSGVVALFVLTPIIVYILEH